MGQIKMRCNLASAHYPFNTMNTGNTVVTSQYDQNYDRSTMSQEPYKVDKGVPFVHYMENVLPTVGEYISATTVPNEVLWDATVASAFPSDPTSSVYDIVECFCTVGSVSTYVVSIIFTDSGIFIHDPNLIGSANYPSKPTWLKSQVFGRFVFKTTCPQLLTIAAGSQITRATVNGITYFFLAGIGCFYYDPSIAEIRNITLAALNTPAILGICSSNGYMIAYTASAIAWSSTTNPLDFTPSTTTGAANGSLQQARGSIKFCLPIAGGFIAYCTGNAVAANYQPNILWPFIFAEIGNSGGVESIKHVAYNSSMQAHYAWTTAGLQMITKSSADPVMADVSDYFFRNIYEQFSVNSLGSPVTSAAGFIRYKLAKSMWKRLDIFMNRYVFISYGPQPADQVPIITTGCSNAADTGNPNDNTYTSTSYKLYNSGVVAPQAVVYYNAIVYDIHLKRYGVLKPSPCGFTYVGDFRNMFAFSFGVNADAFLAGENTYSGITPWTLGAHNTDPHKSLFVTSDALGATTSDSMALDFTLTERNKSNIYFVDTKGRSRMLTIGADGSGLQQQAYMNTVPAAGDTQISSVLILGKFQFIRDRFIAHHVTEVTGAQLYNWSVPSPSHSAPYQDTSSVAAKAGKTSLLSVGILVELPGRFNIPPAVNFSWTKCISSHSIATAGYAGQGTIYSQWAKVIAGQCYSVVLVGNYENLASVVTMFTTEGKR